MFLFFKDTLLLVERENILKDLSIISVVKLKASLWILFVKLFDKREQNIHKSRQ